MVNITNITELDLQPNEYCYLVGRHFYDDSSFKVKLPRIMAHVNGNGRESFNKNILVNANTCKPSISSSVYVQDYITVKRSSQCNLLPVATIYRHPLDNYPTIIASGRKVRCTCTNNNYKELRIVDYE